MRNLSLLALAAAVALAVPVAASATERQAGATITTSVTRTAVDAHLNSTAIALQNAASDDPTDGRIIVAAHTAYDTAVKYWKNDDYVPAEDYAKATDALLAVANADGRGASDVDFDETGRLVAELSPASAMWLTSFATDLFDRAVSARSADPVSAARDLQRAAGVARASQFATLATSGSPQDQAPTAITF